VAKPEGSLGLCLSRSRSCIPQVAPREAQSRFQQHRPRKRVLADAPVSEKREAILQSHRHRPVVRVHEAEQSTARNELIFGKELAIVAWTQPRENALRVSKHASDSLARRK